MDLQQQLLFIHFGRENAAIRNSSGGEILFSQYIGSLMGVNASSVCSMMTTRSVQTMY